MGRRQLRLEAVAKAPEKVLSKRAATRQVHALRSTARHYWPTGGPDHGEEKV